MFANPKGRDIGHALIEKIGRDGKDTAAAVDNAANQVQVLNSSLAALTALVGALAVRVTALEKKKKKDD